MSFVDLLFAFLNFGVLIFLFWYVFRSKFLPQFIRDIRDQKAQRQAAEKQREEFFEKLALIGQERENREDLYNQISSKVVRWKQVEAARERELLKEKELIFAHLVDRISIQQERAAMQRVRARVVPQALAQARLELYDFFQKDHVGDTYINGIIKAVDNREKEHDGHSA